MKRKITTRTKSIPNPERRRFLEKAGGVMAGSLILPSLSFAVGNPGQESMQTLANLKNAVSGSVIEHGTPNYEPWRRSMIWQYRNFRRYPDIMVQAENEDDVVAAVKFARENKLKITTRSGGHSWSGCFLRNGGVLLDLSRLQSVKIDVEGKQAIVEPGVIGRVLNARLGEVGLAFPTAHCGMVGVSGFLLGGGLGLNGTAWGGISTSNIQAIDLVTAEGEKLHASAEENQDYFWAARGAGPGLFFTVTRFYLKCYALPKAITTAMYTLPYSELVALAEALDELGPNIDPRIEMLGVVIPTPQELKTGGKYGNHRHVCLLSATAFVDSTSEAARILEPITRHPVMKNALDILPDRATTIEMLYHDNEVPFPQAHARVDNIFTNRVAEATEVLSRHMPSAPSNSNTPVILWRGDLDFPNSAYSSEGRFYFAGYAQWAHAADDYANQEWLRLLFDDLQPYALGHYINEFDRETRPLQTSACFSEANWEKLQYLRRRYDPDGVFHTFLGMPS
jgi:FAD/FMN-containing dehydrogenase